MNLLEIPCYPIDGNILSFFHQYPNKIYFYRICSYLIPKEIGILNELSHEYTHSTVIDSLWKGLCIYRWLSHRDNISDGLCMKKEGIPSWKLTYKVWEHEMKIPYGKFMPITQRVFGKNRGHGIDCWFYLRHASDCVLHSSTKYSNSVIGNIRLCLQNTQLTPIQFHLLTSFQIYLRGEDTSPLRVISSQLSSKNGIEETSPSGECTTLRYLEFAVITMQILCPLTISNEVDLLSSLDRIHVIGWKSCHLYNWHLQSKLLSADIKAEESLEDDSAKGEIVTLTIPVIEEDKVWNAYQSAPGGVILLKEINQMMIGH